MEIVVGSFTCMSTKQTEGGRNIREIYWLLGIQFASFLRATCGLLALVLAGYTRGLHLRATLAGYTRGLHLPATLAEYNWHLH